MYIDDANSVEKVRVPGSVVNISQKKQITHVHAIQSQELLNEVTIRAADIKMRVNHKKNSTFVCVG